MSTSTKRAVIQLTKCDVSTLRRDFVSLQICGDRVNVELTGLRWSADMVVLIWVFTWLSQVLPGESYEQVREGSL